MPYRDALYTQTNTNRLTVALHTHDEVKSLKTWFFVYHTLTKEGCGVSCYQSHRLRSFGHFTGKITRRSIRDQSLGSLRPAVFQIKWKLFVTSMDKNCVIEKERFFWLILRKIRTCRRSDTSCVPYYAISYKKFFLGTWLRNFVFRFRWMHTRPFFYSNCPQGLMM